MCLFMTKHFRVHRFGANRNWHFASINQKRERERFDARQLGISYKCESLPGEDRSTDEAHIKAFYLVIKIALV